jgi:hypothetical protein
MSYDTTVHDALEPPQPRIGDTPQATPAVRPRIHVAVRRAILATSLFVGVLLLITWVVAELTTVPTLNHGGSFGASSEHAGEQDNTSNHSE